MEELGLAGAGALVEALVEVSAEAGEEAGLAAEVIPMPGDGLAMVCLMAILIEDTDLVTHIMAEAIPMVGTHGKNVC